MCERETRLFGVGNVVTGVYLPEYTINGNSVIVAVVEIARLSVGNRAASDRDHDIHTVGIVAWTVIVGYREHACRTGLLWLFGRVEPWPLRFEHGCMQRTRLGQTCACLYVDSKR